MAITPALPISLSSFTNEDNNSDENLSSLLAKSIVSGVQYEAQVHEKLATLSQLDNAQSYINLQSTLNDYTVTMNLASTLARKSLNIVETLLKAQ